MTGSGGDRSPGGGGPSEPLILPQTPDGWNRFGRDCLPGLIGMEVLSISAEHVDSRLVLREAMLAPNGFLHAATIVALADTSCGYGTLASLPEGAAGFTTIELKSNFVGTATAGAVTCRAFPTHRGRSTAIWDAVVSAEDTCRKLALFRCSQLILWPQSAGGGAPAQRERNR
jgi:uncharacterized protein (TIGR00369 family)